MSWIGKRARRQNSDWAEAWFGPLIEELPLDPRQKQFLRLRWLDQVRYMEMRAQQCKRWYQRLRSAALVGGVIIPALIGLNVRGGVSEAIRWSVFALGLVVALATAVEGLFHFGDAWRHYRRIVESLKSEGWHFFQMTGPYSRRQTHAEAYPAFAQEVENLVQRDVEVFFTRVVQEAKPQEEEQERKGEEPGGQPRRR